MPLRGIETFTLAQRSRSSRTGRRLNSQPAVRTTSSPWHEDNDTAVILVNGNIRSWSGGCSETMMLKWLWTCGRR